MRISGRGVPESPQTGPIDRADDRARRQAVAVNRSRELVQSRLELEVDVDDDPGVVGEVRERLVERRQLRRDLAQLGRASGRARCPRPARGSPRRGRSSARPRAARRRGRARRTRSRRRRPRAPRRRSAACSPARAQPHLGARPGSAARRRAGASCEILTARSEGSPRRARRRARRTRRSSGRSPTRPARGRRSRGHRSASPRPGSRSSLEAASRAAARSAGRSGVRRASEVAPSKASTMLVEAERRPHGDLIELVRQRACDPVEQAVVARHGRDVEREDARRASDARARARRTRASRGRRARRAGGRRRRRSGRTARRCGGGTAARRRRGR